MLVGCRDGSGYVISLANRIAQLKPAIPDDVIPTSGRRFLPTLFAGAVIVAALYYGQELLVPLVLASLLAFVLAPSQTCCRRSGSRGCSRS